MSIAGLSGRENWKDDHRRNTFAWFRYVVRVLGGCGNVEYLGPRLLPRAMIPIAIGRFHQDQIGGPDHVGVPQQRRVSVAQVTAEDDLSGLSTLRYP